MPLPSASSLRYMRPVSFSCSVVAISTEKTCTPVVVTISRVWKLAARAAVPESAKESAKASAIASSAGDFNRREKLAKGMEQIQNWRPPAQSRGSHGGQYQTALLQRKCDLRPRSMGTNAGRRIVIGR